VTAPRGHSVDSGGEAVWDPALADAPKPLLRPALREALDELRYAHDECGAALATQSMTTSSEWRQYRAALAEMVRAADAVARAAGVGS
jgi:hypothetical protein